MAFSIIIAKIYNNNMPFHHQILFDFICMFSKWIFYPSNIFSPLLFPQIIVFFCFLLLKGYFLFCFLFGTSCSNFNKTGKHVFMEFYEFICVFCNNIIRKFEQEKNKNSSVLTFVSNNFGCLSVF